MPEPKQDIYSKLLSERVAGLTEEKSAVKLYEYLLAKLNNEENSLKLSDLTQFLAVQSKAKDRRTASSTAKGEDLLPENPKTVATSFSDLEKFNANQLAELCKKFAELYYENIGTLPANRFRKSAIHALLFKTIEQTIKEKGQAPLDTIVEQIQAIVDSVKPPSGSGKESLLEGFSDFVSPLDKRIRIQDVMNQLLYRSDQARSQEDIDEVASKLRKLCYRDMRIGQADIDAYEEELRARKIHCEHRLGILGDDKKSEYQKELRKIVTENISEKEREEIKTIILPLIIKKQHEYIENTIKEIGGLREKTEGTKKIQEYLSNINVNKNVYIDVQEIVKKIKEFKLNKSETGLVNKLIDQLKENDQLGDVLKKEELLKQCPEQNQEKIKEYIAKREAFIKDTKLKLELNLDTLRAVLRKIHAGERDLEHRLEKTVRYAFKQLSPDVTFDIPNITKEIIQAMSSIKTDEQNLEAIKNIVTKEVSKHKPHGAASSQVEIDPTFFDKFTKAIFTEFKEISAKGSKTASLDYSDGSIGSEKKGTVGRNSAELNRFLGEQKQLELEKGQLEEQKNALLVKGKIPGGAVNDVELEKSFLQELSKVCTSLRSLQKQVESIGIQKKYNRQDSGVQSTVNQYKEQLRELKNFFIQAELDHRKKGILEYHCRRVVIRKHGLPDSYKISLQAHIEHIILFLQIFAKPLTNPHPPNLAEFIKEFNIDGGAFKNQKVYCEKFLETYIRDTLDKAIATRTLHNEQHTAQLTASIAIKEKQIQKKTKEIEEKQAEIGINKQAQALEDEIREKAKKDISYMIRGGGEGKDGFLTEDEFKKYFALRQNALKKAMSSPESKDFILIPANSSQTIAADSPWNQIYDVIINVKTKQCLLVFQGDRGTHTEELLVGKGNFGDVALAFDLFTNQFFAVKKEDSVLKLDLPGAVSKLGIEGGLLKDAQATKGREKELRASKAARLVIGQHVVLVTATKKEIIEEKLKYAPNSRKYIERSMGEKISEESTPSSPEGSKREKILTIQPLLASKKDDFKGDVKEEIVALNQRFIIATSVGRKSSETSDSSSALTGNSDFYQRLKEIDSASPERKEILNKSLDQDLEERFKIGLKFLEAMKLAHNGSTGLLPTEKYIHGDAKPKNVKGGECFDLGTTTLDQDVGNKQYNTMNSAVAGTVEFMPPEYMFVPESIKGEKIDPITKQQKEKSEENKLTDYNVRVTKAGDVYSTGVSLFGYTDLETYKAAFELHNPNKPFPYANYGKNIPEHLIKDVDGRKYVRIYDYPTAEGSGLELMEALATKVKLNPDRQEFKDLQERLNILFKEMCHYDSNQRKDIDTALSAYAGIQETYLELLKEQRSTVDLSKQLTAAQQAQDESMQKIHLKLQTQVDGKSMSVLAALVSKYQDRQASSINLAISQLKTSNVVEDLLGITKEQEKTADISPLLIAAKLNKTEIFKKLFSLLSKDQLVWFLQKEKKNNNRDIVYLAAKNNNYEILKAIFDKLDEQPLLGSKTTLDDINKLKAELILGCPQEIREHVSQAREDSLKLTANNNLLAWASYHKNIEMLEMFSKELKQALSAQVPSMADGEFIAMLDNVLQKNSLAPPNRQESIFYTIAHNNDLDQFMQLCGIFYSQKTNSYASLKDLPIEMLIKFGQSDWKDERTKLTPLAVLFGKNKDFVEEVLRKICEDPSSLTEPVNLGTQNLALLKLLVTPTDQAKKLSPIQVAFAENNDQVIEQIVKLALNPNLLKFKFESQEQTRTLLQHMLAMQDQEGNNVLHYLVKKHNLSAIKNLVDAVLVIEDQAVKTEMQQELFNAINQKNTDQLTPLTSLVRGNKLDQTEIKRDQEIFLTFNRVIDLQSSTSKYLNSIELNITSASSGEHKQAFLCQAIAGEKYIIADQILSKISYIADPPTRVKMLTDELNAKLPEDNSSGKNLFHYLFEKNLLSEQQLKQEQQSQIKGFFCNATTVFFDLKTSANQEAAEGVKTIIELLGTSVKLQQGGVAHTPFTLAIKQGSKDVIVAWLSDQKLQQFKNYGDLIVDSIFLKPNVASETNFLEYLLKDKKYITDILIPIFDNLDRTNKEKIILYIENYIRKSLGVSSEPQTSPTPAIQELQTLVKSYKSKELQGEVEQKLDLFIKQLTGQNFAWTSLTDPNNGTKIREYQTLSQEITRLLEENEGKSPDTSLPSVVQSKIAELSRLQQQKNLELLLKVQESLGAYEDKVKKYTDDLQANQQNYEDFKERLDKNAVKSLSEECKSLLKSIETQYAKVTTEFQSRSEGEKEPSKTNFNAFAEAIEQIHTAENKCKEKHDLIIKVTKDLATALQVEIEQLMLAVRALKEIDTTDLTKLCKDIDGYIKALGLSNLSNAEDKRLFQKVKTILNPEYLKNELQEVLRFLDRIPKTETTAMVQDTLELLSKARTRVADLKKIVNDASATLLSEQPGKMEGRLITIEQTIKAEVENKNTTNVRKIENNISSINLSSAGTLTEESLLKILQELSTGIKKTYDTIFDSSTLDKSILFRSSQYDLVIEALKIKYQEIQNSIAGSQLSVKGGQLLLDHVKEYEQHFFDKMQSTDLSIPGNRELIKHMVSRQGLLSFPKDQQENLDLFLERLYKNFYTSSIISMREKHLSEFNTDSASAIDISGYLTKLMEQYSSVDQHIKTDVKVESKKMLELHQELNSKLDETLKKHVEKLKENDHSRTNLFIGIIEQEQVRLQNVIEHIQGQLVAASSDSTEAQNLRLRLEQTQQDLENILRMQKEAAEKLQGRGQDFWSVFAQPVSGKDIGAMLAAAEQKHKALLQAQQAEADQLFKSMQESFLSFETQKRDMIANLRVQELDSLSKSRMLTPEKPITTDSKPLDVKPSSGTEPIEVDGKGSPLVPPPSAVVPSKDKAGGGATDKDEGKGSTEPTGVQPPGSPIPMPTPTTIPIPPTSEFMGRETSNRNATVQEEEVARLQFIIQIMLDSLRFKGTSPGPTTPSSESKKPDEPLEAQLLNLILARLGSPESDGPLPAGSAGNPPTISADTIRILQDLVNQIPLLGKGGDPAAGEAIKRVAELIEALLKDPSMFPPGSGASPSADGGDAQFAEQLQKLLNAIQQRASSLPPGGSPSPVATPGGGTPAAATTGGSPPPEPSDISLSPVATPVAPPAGGIPPAAPLGGSQPPTTEPKKDGGGESSQPAVVMPSAGPAVGVSPSPVATPDVSSPLAKEKEGDPAAVTPSEKKETSRLFRSNSVPTILLFRNPATAEKPPLQRVASLTKLSDIEPKLLADIQEDIETIKRTLSLKPDIENIGTVVDGLVSISKKIQKLDSMNPKGIQEKVSKMKDSFKAAILLVDKVASGFIAKEGKNLDHEKIDSMALVANKLEKLNQDLHLDSKVVSFVENVKNVAIELLNKEIKATERANRQIMSRDQGLRKDKILLNEEYREVFLEYFSGVSPPIVFDKERYKNILFRNINDLSVSQQQKTLKTLQRAAKQTEITTINLNRDLLLMQEQIRERKK